MNQTSGHRALRSGRHSAPSQIYLVTFATQGRQPWFRDTCMAAAACRSFAVSAKAADAHFICWVVMPDHFHALLRLGATGNLSRCVQRVKGHATTACRDVRRLPAPIWARAFHDHALRREEDLLETARYVIGNPVRAGLVADSMDYPFWDADWL